jgi:dTDP-4-amino-4,6-dideoxygalactose transaminase
VNWRVPLSDIDLGEEEITAVEEVLRSKWLSMGSVTKRFEQAAAEYLEAKHVFAVANGTTALHLAYAALRLGPGDEVILPSLTFVATANAVLYTGATPVFADIVNLDDLTISPEEIERRITPRTRAIAVMHYGGYPCNMEAILEIARRHRLAVVEDAAHAPGTVYGERKAGTWGDVGCFSFFANKNLVTGEGGLVVTDRDDLADRIRLLRSHGMTTLTWDRHRGHAHSYDVVALGYNYRLDEMRAALGLVQLRKLEANNRRRAEITQTYRQMLAGIPGIQLPFLTHPGRSACHLFPILLTGEVARGIFIERMRSAGIQTSIHYPPIHQFTYYRERFGYEQGYLPLTENVGWQEVTLPLYSEMTDGQVEIVVAAVRAAGE